MDKYPFCSTCQHMVTGAIIERPPTKQMVTDKKTGAKRWEHSTGAKTFFTMVPCQHGVSEESYNAVVAKLIAIEAA